MVDSSPVGRLRAILGSDGPWLLTVLAFLGVAGTFFSFGWQGVFIFLLIILVLMVVVLGRAALTGPAITKADSLDAGSASTIEDSLAHSTAARATTDEGEEASLPDETDEEGSQPALKRAVDSAIARDVAAANSALDEWLAEEADPEEMPHRRALGEVVLMRAGDGAALERLRVLADQHSRDAKVQSVYIDALTSNGAIRKAVDEVQKRLEPLNDAEGRSKLRLTEARLRLQLGELEAAKALCHDLSEPVVAFDVAVLSAQVAAKEGDHALSLAYYERAMSIVPTNAATRFKLAYAASQAGLPELSVHHYRILERSGAAGSVALNNFGAVLEQGGALGLSRDYWRRAAMQGCALASGNLANAAAIAGFLEEALTFAESASDQDESPRVGEALERIAQTRLNDEGIREGMEEQGRAISTALGRLLDSSLAPSLPEGAWQVGGKAFEFATDENVSTGSEGNGASCVLFLDESDLLRFEFRDSAYGSKRSGVAVEAPDGDGLVLVVIGEGTSTDRVLHGRPVQT